MDFRLDEEQLGLQETVARFCAARFPLEQLSQRDGRVDESTWHELAELGVFGLLVPGSDGRRGLGVVEAAIVFEQLGAHLVSGPVLWSTLAAPYVDGAAQGAPLVGGVEAVETDGDAIVVEHAGEIDALLILRDDGVFVCAGPERPVFDPLVPFDPLTPVGRVAGLPRGTRVGDARDAAELRRVGALCAALLLACRHASDPALGSAASSSASRSDRSGIQHPRRHVRAHFARAQRHMQRRRAHDPEISDPARDRDRNCSSEAAGTRGVRCTAAWASPGRCFRTTFSSAPGCSSTRSATAKRTQARSAIRSETGWHDGGRIRRRLDHERGRCAAHHARSPVAQERARSGRDPAHRGGARGGGTDDSLRVVVLGGGGADFCAGADWVAANAGGARPRTGSLQRRIKLQAHRLIELLIEIQLPVVCGVRGWAAGLGFQLALAADFAIAAESACFWQPFIERGFSADSGATWLLPRLVGIARAKELLLLGRKLSGAEAASWGIIHRAVADEELDAAVAALVAQLAALGLTKHCIHHSLESGLAAAMEGETFALELSSRTADFKEGLLAFQERRAARFEGH
jgi:2-(1,2-epoxy-1,2-dihydrophenyl)acetyl-CoA isomerase